MALVCAILLIIALLLRPMELWPFVAKLHLLETLALGTAIGVAIDATRTDRVPGISPQMKWLAAFFVWAYLGAIAKLGVDGGLKAGWSITLGVIFMVLIVLALRSLSRLRAFAAVIIACMTLVSAIAIHQGLQPRQCVEQREDVNDPSPDREIIQIPDGRECEGSRICEQGGITGSDYTCERVGMFGTFSTQGRVRWRGQLDDPNEVAVIIGAMFPFLAMFASRMKRSPNGRSDAPPPSAPLSAPPSGTDAEKKPSPIVIVAVLVVLGLGLWAAVLTQSRGGQLVIGAATVGVLIRRFGWWSLVAGAVVTVPIMLLSWRSGAEADSSSLERAEILNEGLLMLKAHPIIGIGVGQFAGENPLNMAAHNSYLLVSTELGFPGYLLWCGLIWMTVKIPLVISRRPPANVDHGYILFAQALAVSIIGLLIGVFFLSFVYKHIFFIWIGLTSALYGAVRKQNPDFEVETTGRDLGGIFALAVLSIAAVRIAASTAR